MRRSLALIACLLPLAAVAAPSDELAKTKKEIEASEKQKERLAEQQEQVEKELEALKEKLVAAAAKLQKVEAQLDETQKKSKELEAELDAKEKSAEEQKKRLDSLSRIAIRLSRTPPQAMVLMPTDGKQRIQAAHALSLLSGEIKTQADLLEKEMKELSELKEKVEAQKAKYEKTRASYKEEKKDFELTLKSRKELRDKLARARTQEDAKLALLAKKANSLQELLESIQEEAEKPIKTKGKDVISEEGTQGTRGDLRDFRSAKGKIRIPVTGRVVTGYGDRDGSSDSSKGIKISTRSGATVVAPFDAEVAYTGTFLNYGRLVILKHAGDYHTLLAGLGRIDVKAGDFLLEGEPIGVMDNGDNKQLYVELREKNQPVNPGGWMRGL